MFQPTFPTFFFLNGFLSHKLLSSIALVTFAVAVSIQQFVSTTPCRVVRSASRRCRLRVAWGVVWLLVFERYSEKALTVKGTKTGKKTWLVVESGKILWKDCRRLFLRDCDYTIPDLIWGYCNYRFFVWIRVRSYSWGHEWAANSAHADTLRTNIAPECILF